MKSRNVYLILHTFCQWHAAHANSTLPSTHNQPAIHQSPEFPRTFKLYKSPAPCYTTIQVTLAVWYEIYSNVQSTLKEITTGARQVLVGQVSSLSTRNIYRGGRGSTTPWSKISIPQVHWHSHRWQNAPPWTTQISKSAPSSTNKSTSSKTNI